MPIVNPFLRIDLSQLEFYTVLLEDRQVFVNDYAKTVSLVPQSPGMHMPKSLYDYM